MWQGMNRRKFPRADFPCNITIYKKGQKEKISARTENIGVGGISVVLKNALDKLSMVDLVLYLENGQAAVECEGRVVWVVKSKEEFDIGIEFLNLKDNDRERIERIVQECLKKEQTSSQGQ